MNARRWAQTAILLLVLACSRAKGTPHADPSSYLYVWAGPNGAARGGNDFLAVIDADTASAEYGRLVGSGDAGIAGAMAHHTELALPARYPLFASDFTTGRIFLLDVSDPRAPRVVARIDSVPGYRRPHSFARRENGNVIATLQFGNGSVAGDPGGLAEFDTAGHLIRTSAAADRAFPGARIRPNGVELLPAIDRIVTTSMPMDDEVTADVIQIWRLADLKLLHTIAVPHSAGDSAAQMPYDTRVLADGRTAIVNTYWCALWRLSALDSSVPRIEFVHRLRAPHSEACAVAAVVGHYLIVPDAFAHVVVSLDVADPSRPVEVSTLQTDSSFQPHWISVDRTRSRLVITTGADNGDTRAIIVRIDPSSGRLTFDTRFHDAGSTRPGVTIGRKDSPHGSVADVIIHGAVFGPSAIREPVPSQGIHR